MNTRKSIRSWVRRRGSSERTRSLSHIGFLEYLFCFILRLASSLYWSADFDNLSDIRRVSAHESAFWGSLVLHPIMRVTSSENILQTWIDIFKHNAENIKTCMLSKILYRFPPTFAQWQKNQRTAGGPNTRKTNPRWRMATIWKPLNRDWQRFDWSLGNVAWWQYWPYKSCSAILYTKLTILRNKNP